MVSFVALIKNIVPKDVKNVFRLEVESEEKDKELFLEVPSILNLFKKNDKVEVELSSSPITSKKGESVEMNGRVYDVQKDGSKLIVHVSFWGFLSKIIFSSSSVNFQPRMDIYLNINKV